MTIDEGGPAFPQGGANGLTKREWFAGQALTGLLANPALANNWKQEDVLDQMVGVVLVAFDIASACLADPEAAAAPPTPPA